MTHFRILSGKIGGIFSETVAKSLQVEFQEIDHLENQKRYHRLLR